MIQEFIKKVGEFHDAFGVKRGNVDVELRYKLFKEEYEEYLEAKNLVEKADAIVDMLYIACGTIDLHEHEFNDKWSQEDADGEDDTLYIIKECLNTYKCYREFVIFEDIILLCLDLAYINNIYDKLPELFQEVQNSNMSKLEDGKPIINDGIIDPTKPVGKILKGKNFFEPNLEKILCTTKIKS